MSLLQSRLEKYRVNFFEVDLEHGNDNDDKGNLEVTQHLRTLRNVISVRKQRVRGINEARVVTRSLLPSCTPSSCPFP